VPLRSEEVTWVAEYNAWACGDFTARLLPVDVADSQIDLSRLGLGLDFYVPLGLTAPDQLEEVGVQGNRFLIRGHYFYREAGGRRIVVPRFDLLGWQPVPPFQRWEDREARLVDDPGRIYSRFQGSPVEPEEMTFQIAGKYLDC